ncbi:MAG TPA: DinB family protein [Candidatus Acidoferrales bacterium]|nr:DinB family protein [Candidatus Acidoferrales bacterium]
MRKSPVDAYGLVDSWHLNNRVNLLLLGHLSEAQLASLADPRTRSIADQFAHLHNVRILWLAHALPQAVAALPKIEKGAATKLSLQKALNASAKAVAEVFAEAEKTGKLKGSKRGPLVFFGYLLAHEAHHRGQIILHLKYANVPIDKTFGFSLWEWQNI